MFCITVRHGSSRGSWNTYPRWAGLPSWVTSTDPAEGVSTPERMLSRVLLPHPEGPTMETKTCPDSSKLTSLIARTGGPPFLEDGNTLERCLTLTVAMSHSCARRMGSSSPRWGRSCGTQRLWTLLDGDLVAVNVAPAEGAPLHRRQDPPIDQDDDDEEQENPADEALVAGGVVPVTCPPPDPVGRPEPLGEQHAVPADDHGEAKPGENVACDGREDKGSGSAVRRDPKGMGHHAQVGGDRLHAVDDVDRHEREGRQYGGPYRRLVAEPEPDHRDECPDDRRQGQEDHQGVVEQGVRVTRRPDEDAHGQADYKGDDQANAKPFHGDRHVVGPLALEHAAVRPSGQLDPQELEDLPGGGNPGAQRGEQHPSEECRQVGGRPSRPRRAHHLPHRAPGPTGLACRSEGSGVHGHENSVPTVRHRNRRRSRRTRTTRSTMIMKMMKRSTQASTPRTENLWNDSRIRKPTPLEEPNTSVSCSTFHARANDRRTPANTNGSIDGNSTWRATALGFRRNTSDICRRCVSTPSSPSATLRAMYGIETRVTDSTGPHRAIPKMTRAITA